MSNVKNYNNTCNNTNDVDCSNINLLKNISVSFINKIIFYKNNTTMGSSLFPVVITYKCIEDDYNNNNKCIFFTDETTEIHVDKFNEYKELKKEYLSESSRNDLTNKLKIYRVPYIFFNDNHSITYNYLILDNNNNIINFLIKIPITENNLQNIKDEQNKIIKLQKKKFIILIVTI